MIKLKSLFNRLFGGQRPVVVNITIDARGGGPSVAADIAKAVRDATRFYDPTSRRPQ